MSMTGGDAPREKENYYNICYSSSYYLNYCYDNLF